MPITYKDLVPFVEVVADRPKDTEKVARLGYAILASGSARKSDWARHYRQEANGEANHKAIGRLLEGLDSKRLLHRLIDTQHPILLADPTEVRRPQAKHTPYVGRAVPVHGGRYSQATLEAEGTTTGFGGGFCGRRWRGWSRDRGGCLTGSSPLGDGLRCWRRRGCGTPSG